MSVADNLIQIIRYETHLEPNSGKKYVKQIHFKDIVVTSAQGLFNNLEAIASLIPEKLRYDCHYTIANCLPPSKEVPLRRFHHQEVIPFDLDDVDLEKKDQYIDIVCKKCGINKDDIGIYCSGNGLHLIILLDKGSWINGSDELTIHRRYYKELTSIINLDFFQNGLTGKLDAQRFTEAATLRLPLTWNDKDKENVKLATVIQGPPTPINFDLRKIVDVKESEEVAQTVRAVDTKAVLTGCDFLKYCYENQHIVTEPQWYAMVGTLVFLPDVGSKLVHTYSIKHAMYNEEDTERKAEQALSFGKPRTCDSINQVFPRCVSCPHYKKVKTPLAIKGEDFIGTQATGFHNVVPDKNGQPAKFVPNYDDLRKYFAKKHTFVVNSQTQHLSVFNGKCWEPFSEHAVEGFATKHFDPIASNAKRSEFTGLIYSSNLVDPNFFSKDNYGFINFTNGVLRLKDRVLLPHSPSYGFIYSLPYEYNPHATCPRFNEMMKNVTMEDQQLEDILLEFMGYGISGMKSSYGAKALILTGDGSNGKSTYLNIFKRLVGDTAFSTVSLSGMSSPNNLYNMAGKLFNICEEVDKDELRDGTATFKSIVTGANMMVKKLYADTVSMRIDTKLILSCNEIPTARENNFAIYRRMLIVPFRASFRGAKDDRNTEDKIAPEMSGIYNRVLDALDRFISNKYRFTDSVIVEKQLEEYKNNNSVYNLFADTHYTQGGTEDFISTDEMMRTYNDWAQLNNILTRPSSIMLVKELRTLGLIRGDSVVRRVGGKSARGYLGIKKINEEVF